MTNFSLRNKVILLTGASGHFGRMMAKGIAKAGAEVILTGRTEKNLESLSSDILLSGGKSHSILLEVGNEVSHFEALDNIKAKYGRLDGIVNNAYSGRAGTIDKINSKDFSNACMQNLSGPFHLIQSALPLLEQATSTESGEASIVNIASMYGRVSPDPRIYGTSGQNNPVHYGATKAGLIQMTRYLACHLADKKIRVNSISPGAFPNPDIKNSAPEFLDKLEQKIPMGRIGEASEIVGPVLFLLSSSSSYVTGADLPVDGGWTAW